MSESAAEFAANFSGISAPSRVSYCHLLMKTAKRLITLAAIAAGMLALSSCSCCGGSGSPCATCATKKA
jgi:hypothetical protein